MNHIDKIKEHMHKGEVYYARTLAEKHIRTCVENICSECPSAMYLLGICHMALSQWEKAIFWLKESGYDVDDKVKTCRANLGLS